MNAKVWAISEKDLFEKRKWQGFLKEDLDYYAELFRKKAEFLTRGPLETNPNYKQIIGQVVLQVGNKFLLHRISGSSSEERLHDLWPILLGGHIDEIDAQHGQDVVQTAIDREFQEEVAYSGKILKKIPLGLVYLDDGNAVNRVHVGLVYLYLGDSEKVRSREDALRDVQFASLEELEKNKDRLTYWSRLVLPQLKKFL